MSLPTLPSQWPLALTSDQAGQAARAVVIAVLALFLGGRLRGAVVALLSRRSAMDPAIALLGGRLTYFAVLVVAALWILNLFGNNITPLLTVLGAAGLAISLALQDVLRNLFAGVYLLVERPFTIGNVIEVKGITGTVVSVELRLTVLTTFDGLQVTVPNATVFTEVIVNRSIKPFQRWLLLVTLPPNSNDLTAIRAAVREAAGQTGIRAPESDVAVQAATAGGILLQVSLWAPDAVALGEVILALRQKLPNATVSVPGAPAMSAPAVPAAPRRRRVTRRRPSRPSHHSTPG